jgi:thiosulfate dehydrogenase (quinone) large subunit
MSITDQAKPRKTKRAQYAPEASSPAPHAVTATAVRVIALLRIVAGAFFLWVFLDKAFGLGYSTPESKAWIHGNSPTAIFLSNVHVGPFASALRSWAGMAWADWLFMTGMAGVGLALLLGIGLRVAAAAGTTVMLLMWISEWPPARTSEAGRATGSANPVIDEHVIYALLLITLAALSAGRTWGLGRWWSRLVGRNRWLI